MSLSEITGKRVSAFSREHRPAENGGANSLQHARVMDAFDGDLDLACNWKNCRATLAVIETTTRTDQSVTYRRTLAARLGVPFFHVREIQQPDGSWRYQTMEPADPALLTMDEWVVTYEVPVRFKHGCRPWSLARMVPFRRKCTLIDCDNDPDWHCPTCWRHYASVYDVPCPEHSETA